jgi:hypothetical protein
MDRHSAHKATCGAQTVHTKQHVVHRHSAHKATCSAHTQCTQSNIWCTYTVHTKQHLVHRQCTQSNIWCTDTVHTKTTWKSRKFDYFFYLCCRKETHNFNSIGLLITYNACICFAVMCWWQMHKISVLSTETQQQPKLWPVPWNSLKTRMNIVANALDYLLNLQTAVLHGTFMLHNSVTSTVQLPWKYTLSVY